jgi:hypothetical protein
MVGVKRRSCDTTRGASVPTWLAAYRVRHVAWLRGRSATAAAACECTATVARYARTVAANRAASAPTAAAEAALHTFATTHTHTQAALRARGLCTARCELRRGCRVLEGPMQVKSSNTARTPTHFSAGSTVMVLYAAMVARRVATV